MCFFLSSSFSSSFLPFFISLLPLASLRFSPARARNYGNRHLYSLPFQRYNWVIIYNISRICMLHFSGRNTLPLTTPKRNLLLPFGFLACTVVNTVALTILCCFQIAPTQFLYPSPFSFCLSFTSFITSVSLFYIFTVAYKKNRVSLNLQSCRLFREQNEELCVNVWMIIKNRTDTWRIKGCNLVTGESGLYHFLQYCLRLMNFYYVKFTRCSFR